MRDYSNAHIELMAIVRKAPISLIKFIRTWAVPLFRRQLLVSHLIHRNKTVHN